MHANCETTHGICSNGDEALALLRVHRRELRVLRPWHPGTPGQAQQRPSAIEARSKHSGRRIAAKNHCEKVFCFSAFGVGLRGRQPIIAEAWQVFVIFLAMISQLWGVPFASPSLSEES